MNEENYTRGSGVKEKNPSPITVLAISSISNSKDPRGLGPETEQALRHLPGTLDPS